MDTESLEYLGIAANIIVFLTMIAIALFQWQNKVLRGIFWGLLSLVLLEFIGLLASVVLQGDVKMTQVPDMVLTLGFAIVLFVMGTSAHLAWKYRWGRWVFYSTISLYMLGLVAISGFCGFIYLMYQTPLMANSTAAKSVSTLAIDSLGWMAGGIIVVLLLSIPLLIPYTRKKIMTLLKTNPDSYPHLLGLLIFLFISVFLSLSISVLYNKEIILQQLKGTSLPISASIMVCSLTLVTAGGVGIFIRRSWKSALERVGLIALKPHQAGLCFLFAFLMLGGLMALDSLIIHPLFPDAFQLNIEFDQAMRLKGSPLELFLGAVLVALCAGIGEELVFRGLLQPAFGLFPASALFALLHVHYGISILVLQIFILGFVFGLIRKHFGTTGSIITHSTFDLTVLLITSFDLLDKLNSLISG